MTKTTGRTINLTSSEEAVLEAALNHYKKHQWFLSTDVCTTVRGADLAEFHSDTAKTVLDKWLKACGKETDTEEVAA